MKVTIKDLPPEGKLIEDRIPAEALAFDESHAFAGPIEARVELRKSGRQVTASGSVRTALTLRCHRCLESYRLPIETVFEHYFLPRPERQAYQQMMDLDEAELGLSYYDGEQIDLGPSIHDAVLLEVPLKQTCRDDCPGICPRCGAAADRCACRRGGDAPPNPFGDFFREQGML